MRTANKPWAFSPFIVSLFFSHIFICAQSNPYIDFLKKNRAQIVGSITGFTAVAASIRGIYNFAELRKVQIEGRTDHLLFGDDGCRVITKLKNWRRDEWPTAASIQDPQKRYDVIKALSSAIINGEFKAIDAYGNPIYNPTWSDIMSTIGREKREIRERLLSLEKKHVSYFSFCPSLFDAYGLLRDYKFACKAEGIDPYGAASWTKDQENRLEQRMKEICQCKWWHFPCMVNYGKATRIYWREYKLWRRLDALRKVIADMNADNVHVQEGPPPYEFVVTQR